MAIALLNITSAGSSNANNITTSAISTLGATLLIASAAHLSTGTGTAVTDSQGNTWTALTSRTGGSARNTLYYCLNPTTSATHTFTLTSTGGGPTISVAAFSGVNSLGGETGNSATTGTSIQPGSLTPTEDNCLVISGLSVLPTATSASNNALTSSSTNSVAAQHLLGAIGYLIQTSAAASNGTWSWTTSANNASAAAWFKSIAGGSAAEAIRRHVGGL